jgi:hypothetical protein
MKTNPNIAKINKFIYTAILSILLIPSTFHHIYAQSATSYYIYGPPSFCKPGISNYSILPQPANVHQYTWTFTDNATVPATLTIINGPNTFFQSYTWLPSANGTIPGGTISITTDLCSYVLFLEVSPCCVEPQEIDIFLPNEDLISNYQPGFFDSQTIFVEDKFIFDQDFAI